jgi:hypothetical protein
MVPLRLGVGINNAFLALSELSKTIESLVLVGPQVFESKKENVVLTVVNFQTHQTKASCIDRVCLSTSWLNWDFNVPHVSHSL